MRAPDLNIPWLQDCWDRNVNPNLMTVSIEHEGKHERDEKGNIITFWEPTEAQYQATLSLTRYLVDELQIPVDTQHLIGHSRIDSVTRTYCPGPGFPWKRLFADLVGGAPFLDVPADAWYAQDLADMKAAGLLRGQDDGRLAMSDESIRLLVVMNRMRRQLTK
jgi:N-acetyl-anhydromuramyl-L-alanine amidase AmpD